MNHISIKSKSEAGKSLLTLQFNAFFFWLGKVLFIFFNWRIIALQRCVHFCCTTSDSAVSIHVSPPSCASSHPHPPSPLSRSLQSLVFCAYSCSPLALYFTHGSVYMSVSLLSICPTLSFPSCVHKSILCVPISALQICSSVPLF